jgi:hypothetical protein
MPKIELTTEIRSDIFICFDLARSIDLHIKSTSKTNENAVDGVISGLIGLNEFVTWEATHFWIKQRLTSKITAFNRPYHFRDEQIKGIFKYFSHDHNFEEKDGKVIMRDVFIFQAPLGFLGTIVDRFLLKSYLENFLIERNMVIKDFAETEKWRAVLLDK